MRICGAGVPPAQSPLRFHLAQKRLGINDRCVGLIESRQGRGVDVGRIDGRVAVFEVPGCAGVADHDALKAQVDSRFLLRGALQKTLPEFLGSGRIEWES